MTFLRTSILFALLLALPACGESSDGGDTPEDTEQTDDNSTDEDNDSTGKGGKDAGGTKPTPTKDAGPGKTEPRDSGTPTVVPKDGGMMQASDAGPKPTVDAGKDSGTPGTVTPPTPPTPDAGTTTPTTPGGKDPNGPCKDLMLFCFDPIDMFLFNPSACFTCNGGKGCQGCAIPYAY